MIGFTCYWPGQMASSQRTIDHILVVFQSLETLISNVTGSCVFHL